MTAKIVTFIKSDLYLPVYDYTLASKDQNAVQFLGFKIYLFSLKKKARTKSKQT